MIYCNIKGGMANMMFQLAALKSMSLEYGVDFTVPNFVEHLTFLNQDNVHNPNLKHSFDYLRFLKGINRNKPNKGMKCFYYPFHYEKKYIEDVDFFVDGFFQSEKYFHNHRKEILEMISPDDGILDIIKTNHSFLSGFKNKTSIHVRRGDYLKFPNHHPVQSIEYYNSAIDLLKCETDLFVVFSDDIQWCKDNLKLNNVYYVSDLDYIELFLMSMCENNIIANSSFSWWGAWLNKNENKKVVAPLNWFGPAIQENTNDIIPENWIKI